MAVLGGSIGDPQSVDAAAERRAPGHAIARCPVVPITVLPINGQQTEFFPRMKKAENICTG